MLGGISRNFPWQCRRAPWSFEGGAEPAKVAGIAPLPELEGDGERLRPEPRPERVPSMRFRPSRRAPGKWQGLRAAPRSERGFRRASASRGSSKVGTASGPPSKYHFDGTQGPASFERATGEASASMRTLETERLRPGRIRPGKRRGISVLPSDPTGIGEGPSGLSRDPPGTERGFAASLRNPGESEGGRLRPPRDPKPPSERWPRHPATAVKAGTSGGRWRHRPPL